MLERFHVSDEEAIRINHLKMHSVVMQIFIKMGLSDENSKTAGSAAINIGNPFKFIGKFKKSSGDCTKFSLKSPELMFPTLIRLKK